MIEKLTYSDEVQCTVLEVRVIEGHRTTIDVVRVNGVLHQGDQIVVCGMQGPIVTTIRTLLAPHPMKELRVKGTYLHHKEIKAAILAFDVKVTPESRDLAEELAGILQIVGSNAEEHQNIFGRHFDAEDELVSHITRGSIDVLNTCYLEELSTEERSLISRLEMIFRYHEK